METPLKAKVNEVNIDAENDIARFVLSCEIINGDVLRLNCADAQIIVGRNTGLRVPAAAVHYLKADGSEQKPGRELHPRRVCEVRQPGPLLPHRLWTMPTRRSRMAMTSSFCPAERLVLSVRFGFMTRLLSLDKICMMENFCSY